MTKRTVTVSNRAAAQTKFAGRVDKEGRPIKSKEHFTRSRTESYVRKKSGETVHVYHDLKRPALMKRLRAAKGRPVMLRFKSDVRGGGKYKRDGGDGWSSGVEVDAYTVDSMEGLEVYLEQFDLTPDDIQDYSVLVYPYDKKPQH